MACAFANCFASAMFAALPSRRPPSIFHPFPFNFNYAECMHIRCGETNRLNAIAIVLDLLAQFEFRPKIAKEMKISSIFLVEIIVSQMKEN